MLTITKGGYTSRIGFHPSNVKGVVSLAQLNIVRNHQVQFSITTDKIIMWNGPLTLSQTSPGFYVSAVQVF